MVIGLCGVILGVGMIIVLYLASRNRFTYTKTPRNTDAVEIQGNIIHAMDGDDSARQYVESRRAVAGQKKIQRLTGFYEPQGQELGVLKSNAKEEAEVRGCCSPGVKKLSYYQRRDMNVHSTAVLP